MSEYKDSIINMISLELSMQRVRDRSSFKGFDDIEKDIAHEADEVRPIAERLLDSMRRLGYLTGKVLK